MRAHPGKTLLILATAFLTSAVPLFAQTVTCASEDGKRHYCDADTRQGVQMLRQRSGSPCKQGYSWGYDGRGIWVDHGCRADFSLQTAASSSGGRTVTCSSDDGGRHYCDADTRAGVQLIRQRSGSPCTQGYSWGFDDRGIWVDRGCRADFSLEAGRSDDSDRYRDRDRDRDDSSQPPQTVTCASEDGKRHYCDADTRGSGVQMMNQRSGSPCTQGYSWGFDDRGIWVDHGCRADFSVQTRRNNSSGVSCRRAVGPDQADRLVDQCLKVSPATHPPCNADNSCVLIRDEIRRGCRMLGRDAPSFCDEYR
jgi:Protein of unknown function (DUF3011)